MLYLGSKFMIKKDYIKKKIYIRENVSPYGRFYTIFCNHCIMFVLNFTNLKRPSFRSLFNNASLLWPVFVKKMKKSGRKGAKIFFIRIFATVRFVSKHSGWGHCDDFCYNLSILHSIFWSTLYNLVVYLKHVSLY